MFQRKFFKTTKREKERYSNLEQHFNCLVYFSSYITLDVTHSSRMEGNGHRGRSLTQSPVKSLRRRILSVDYGEEYDSEGYTGKPDLELPEAHK